jgi:TetR/AcrR family transcriptional regulator, ethionamide resistance regulator
MSDNGTAPANAGRRRRNLPKGDRREQAILDAAWHLLSEKPLHTITVDELASAAGISRSSFYFYFESRDAAIRSLIISRTTGMANDVLAGAPVHKGPRATVRHLVRGVLRVWLDHGPVMRVLLMGSWQDPDLKALWDPLVDQLLNAMAGGIDAERQLGRALPDPPARDLVGVLWAMLWRVGFEASLTAPSVRQQKRMVDAMSEVILRSIYGSVIPDHYVLADQP